VRLDHDQAVVFPVGKWRGNVPQLLRAGEDKPHPLRDLAPCQASEVYFPPRGTSIDCSRCLERTEVGTFPVPGLPGGIGHIYDGCTRLEVTRVDFAGQVREHKVLTPPSGRHRCTHLNSQPWYDSQERFVIVADCRADTDNPVCLLMTLTPHGVLLQTAPRDPQRPRCEDRAYWRQTGTTETYYEGELPGQESIPQAHYRNQLFESKKATPLYLEPNDPVPP
jgi:hypothetical protein